MALWDVHRDTRTGQIVMIRPAGRFAARLADNLSRARFGVKGFDAERGDG